MQIGIKSWTHFCTRRIQLWKSLFSMRRSKLHSAAYFVSVQGNEEKKSERLTNGALRRVLW